MKLTIGMMVKNESEHLEKCLKSLDPILQAVDSELIIIDTGSEDNTVDIAKKYTNQVYYHPWNNDFSEIRNLTLDYSKGEWYFFIDADEVLSNQETIIDFLKFEHNSNYNSASINIKNVTDDSDISNYVVTSVIRLLKNDKELRFQGSIHEQINFKKPTIKLDVDLLHFGYLSNNIALIERKFVQRETMLINELSKYPHNAYYLYHLSLTYGMHKDYEKSLYYMLELYKLIKLKKVKTKNLQIIYGYLCLVLILNKMYDKAENIGLEAIELRMGYLDIYFYTAKAQSELKKNNEAISNYKNYLNALEEFSKNGSSHSSELQIYTFGYEEKAYLGLCMAYEELGKYEDALSYCNKIKSESLLQEVIVGIINLYIKLNKFKELRDYYSDKIITNVRLDRKFIEILNEFTQKLQDNEKAIIKKIFFSSEGNNTEAKLTVNKESKYKPENLNSDKMDEKFNKYKTRVKNNIENMISLGNLKEAMDCLIEYESIVKNDVDIFSIKAVIAIMSNDLNKAELLLNEVLEIDSGSFDALYNLGYLFELKKNYENAIIYYTKSITACNDDKVKNYVQNVIDNIITINKG